MNAGANLLKSGPLSLKHWLLMCSLAAFALATGYCVWSLHRGFEITDEAYYLLLAMYPSSVKLYVSAQQWSTAHLWGMTGSLAGFRAAGLVVLAGSAAILSHGVFKAFAQHVPSFAAGPPSHLTVASASIVFALLYASTINLSPCYNLLAAAGANASAGFVLLGLCTTAASRRHGFNLLAGFALAMVFVNKPSSAVATCGVLALWWFLVGSRSVKARLADVLLTGVAAFLGVLALAAPYTTLPEVALSLKRGLDLFQMVQTESVGARLGRYVLQFARSALEAITAFGFVIAAFTGYLLTRRQIWLAIFGATLFATMIAGGFLFGGMDQYARQVGSSFVLLGLAMAISFPLWKQKREAVVLVLGLVFLPYCVAVGTGNSIFTQVIVSLGSWGALVAVLACMNYARGSDRAMTGILFVGLVTSAASQLISSGFRMPYHMSQPIAAQNEQVRIRDLGSVLVDAGSRKFVADMEAAVKKCAIPPGAPYFGLYNIPGVALTMGGVPFMTPWLNNLAQAEAVMKYATPDILASSVLAIRLEDDARTPQLPSAFADYKQKFMLCGEGMYPDGMQRVQIWYRAPAL